MIIDLSYHKGELDLQAIRDSGVVANIHKVSDGFFMPYNLEGSYAEINHVDVTFRMYWKQMQDIFDWRGGYHFLRVDDEEAARRGRPGSLAQIDILAQAFAEYGLDDDDYVVLDVEQLPAQINYLSKRDVGKRVKAAVLKMEEIFERKPIIYTGAWWWEMYHHAFDNEFFLEYPFWLSHYWPIDVNNNILYTGSVFYIRDNRVFPRQWLDALEDRIAYCRVPMLNGKPTINPDLVYLWQYAETGKIPGTNNKNIDVNMEIIPEAEWTLARAAEAPEPVPPVYIPDLDTVFHIPNAEHIRVIEELIALSVEDDWSAEKLARAIELSLKLA